MMNFKEKPVAYVMISGSKKHPNIKGRVDLYDTYGGTILVAEIYGIDGDLEELNHGFYGFHIHEGTICAGNTEDAFADTKGHYNPGNTEHPAHAGDLPPLLSSNGVAWMAVYTGRFYPEEVIGRTMVIHGMSDDFKTQPSGNSGEKIACGEIVAWDREIR